MSMKSVMLSTCLSVCLLSGAALADELILSTSAPPPLREEAPPTPRSGYEWARGYWSWDNGHYVWKAGHWVENRPHAHWVPANWTQQDEQHWRYSPGHWEED